MKFYIVTLGEGGDECAMAVAANSEGDVPGKVFEQHGAGKISNIRETTMESFAALNGYENLPPLSGNALKFAKVRPDAKIPTRDDENAGYDIYACFDEPEIEIAPHSTRLIPTGIAAALSNDYYLQVHERGSTGVKGMKYSAGVIDASYRGEIFIALSNVNDHYIVITKSDRPDPERYPDAVAYPYSKAIAQLVVHEVHKMDIEEISYEELLCIPSGRGTGALGSSGK